MSKRFWGIGAAGVLVSFALGVAATYSWLKAKPEATKTEEPRMARAFATHLMFEGAAEKAMKLYVSLFPGSEIRQVERYGPGEQGAEGTIKRADITLGEHHLICIDSPVKHAFTFTPSMSIFVDCENEAELNEAFKQLSEGGKVMMPLDNYGFSKKFGWVSDRFGVSWQLNLR
jgi:predicted 3-demethylubiquinone-9 3-methyltransferase (glyoxalase superfamily)